VAKPESELKKAIKRGESETVRQMISAGLDVNSELPAKVTALEFALAEEQGEIVWELLGLGAKPRKQKNDNLLLDAPKFRDLKLLRHLVDLGADVHAGDRSQQTPLLCAASAGFFDAVRFLLDLGADPQARTKNGKSIFQLVERTRHVCSTLLPESDGEVAELFRFQLRDLDRIEDLLNSTLTPEQVDELSGKAPEKPKPSTFWQVHDEVEFQLEVSPFPCNSKSKTRLKGRLGYHAKQWLKHFSADGQVMFRMRSDEDVTAWRPFTLEGRDDKFLLFNEEVGLSSGKVIIEIQFDTDDERFAGELDGWEIDVA